jgi:hypothetical protein
MSATPHGVLALLRNKLIQNERLVVRIRFRAVPSGDSQAVHRSVVAMCSPAWYHAGNPVVGEDR